MVTVCYHRCWLVIGIYLCAPFAAALANPPTPRATPPSRSDLRLDRRVQTVQREGALVAYLKRVTEDSRVSHQVIDEFAGRPLFALNVKVSLGGLQQSIAETFQLTWQVSSAEPLAYRLYESRSDRNARARALAAARAAGQRKMAERREEVRRMSRMPEAQLREMAASGNGKARALLHPRGMAAQRFSEQLPEGVWRQLWADGEARVPLNSLGAEAEALARTALPSKVLQGEDATEYRSEDLLRTHGEVKLQVGGTPGRPTIWQMINARYFGTTANLLYAEAGTRQPPGERRAQRSTEGRRTRAPGDGRFRKKVTLSDHARPKRGFSGERPLGARPLAEYLEQLAAQVDVPILAECEYKPKDRKWLAEQWWLAEEIKDRPLSEALDLLCADFEFEWEFRHGFITLRPENWYLAPEKRKPIEPNPR